ncbi:hypothetical protein ACVCAH_36270 [Micromonospora sp. LZ34]
MYASDYKAKLIKQQRGGLEQATNALLDRDTRPPGPDRSLVAAQQAASN